ncbi:hypothetical protein ES707_04898 [subsurface metagenome]
MNVSLYARVSSEEQVEGYSIDAQKRSFRTLCQNKEWVPSREYNKLGRSAHPVKIQKRPIFQEVLQNFKKGRPYGANSPPYRENENG